MNFLKYIQSLVPSFSKNSVLESAELTIASLREHTLPSYVMAIQLWKGQKFKSKEVLSIAGEISKSVENKQLFEAVEKSLSNAILILEFAGQYSKKIFSETEANKGLTYVKATILRTVQAAEFANTYARRLLNYIYCFEARAVSAEEQPDMSQAEKDWIEENLADFCICLNALRKEVSDLKKHVEGLPDAVISDLTERTFVTTLGDGKLDPMMMRHLSAKVNPFYLVGIWTASYQANKFKAAQAELELLQLRQMQMEKLFAKTQDAKLQKEIEYLQDRVTGLNFTIQKMEKTYNV